MQPADHGNMDTIDCLFCPLNYFSLSNLVRHMLEDHFDKMPEKHTITRKKAWKWCVKKITESLKPDDE